MKFTRRAIKLNDIKFRNGGGLDKDAVISFIESGMHEKLIGHFESHELECKRTPYRLAEESEKLELAKDVSALANAAGGLILLGWATKKDDVHGSDVISEVCPFPSSLMSEDQYLKVLESWLWPYPDGVQVRKWEISGRPGYAVAVLQVAAIPIADGPILISNSALSDGRRTGLLFGYCERRRAKVDHFDIRRLHALIRDGFRFDGVLANEFASVKALLQVFQGGHVESGVAGDSLHDATFQALRAGGLDEVPAFYLCAETRPVISMSGVFESRDDPLVKLLHDPPAVRNPGFGIDVDINSRIVEGRLRRAVAQDDRVLEMHRSGRIIFACRADGAGLCWNSKGPRLRINQLALVEMVYDFILLSYRAYAGRVDGSTKLKFTVGVERLENEAGTAELVPGPVSRFASGNGRAAPADHFLADVEVAKTHSPDRVAVMLLERLYHWFGLESSAIPYATGEGQARSVNKDQLEAIDPRA